MTVLVDVETVKVWDDRMSGDKTESQPARILAEE